jgi:outer membrane protein
LGNLCVFGQNAVQGDGKVTVLNLFRAVEIAKINNLNIKNSELNLKSAELDYQQSRNNFLPNVNGNINEAGSYGRSLNPFTNTYDPRNINYNNLNLSANVLLYNGGNLKNSSKAAEYNLKASEKDLEDIQNNISLQVALAYLNILIAEDQYKVAETQTKITEQQIERTSKLVEAGNLPVSNLLELKAQLANENSTLINYKGTLETNNLTMIQLLNDPNIKRIKLERMEVPVPNSNAYEGRLEDVYQYALENQPSIKSAEYRVLSAEKAFDAGKSLRLPTLSLSTSWSANQSNALKNRISQGLRDVPFGDITFAGLSYPITTKQEYFIQGSTVNYFDQLRQTNNKVISLNLRIPIFSQGSNKTQIRKLGIQKISAQNQALLASQTLRQNIEQAYISMVNSAKFYESVNSQVISLEESFRSAQASYDVGAIDFVSYNLQKTNLDKAKLNLIQAKYDYVFRSKVLDFYSGKNLTF